MQRTNKKLKDIDIKHNKIEKCMEKVKRIK